EAANELAADLRRRAAEASAELGIPITFIATEGDAYAEIRRIADEIRADAVVVGASAKAGHRLIGSLAVRLVRAGRGPVPGVPCPAGCGRGPDPPGRSARPGSSARLPAGGAPARRNRSITGASRSGSAIRSRCPPR